MPLMDEKDKAILRILQKDARTPFARIARILGVSEATIYLRVKRLIKAGILRGYHADVDPAKAGLATQAFVFVKVSPRRSRDAAEKVRGIPGIYEVYNVTGEYQLIAKVLARDREELARIVDRIGGIDGVSDINVVYVLRVVKEERILRL